MKEIQNFSDGVKYLSHVSNETSFKGVKNFIHKADINETIVYEIVDYTRSLEYAYEMLSRGWHVTSLTFSKELPRPKPNCHDVLLMEGC